MTDAREQYLHDVLETGSGVADRTSMWRIALAAILLVVTWLGVNAVWGLTSDEDTLVSGWLRSVAALDVWLGGALLVLAATAIWSAGVRKAATVGLAAMLVAYLIGVAGSRYAYAAIDPRGGVPFDAYADAVFALWERSFLLYPAIPMLAVYLLTSKRASRPAFRFGDWRVPARLLRQRTRSSWSRYFVYWIVFFIVPFFLLLQAQVGFAPIISGRLFWLFPAVLALALFNAFTEELLFRGFVQHSLGTFIGPAAAVVLQAAFFGIHHWGSSPVPGFLTAVITFALGLVWGLSVLQTRGLGWAVCCHTLVDMTFFSAHFVAVPES